MAGKACTGLVSSGWVRQGRQFRGIEMKTYSSVEEMQQEYARIRARLENPPAMVVKQPSEPKITIIKPTVDPVVYQIEVIKLEHKPDVIKTKIWWHEVVDIVEYDVGIPAFEFMSVRRNKTLSDARLLVYALAADCCPHLSLAAIGRLANKDHTTVLKGRLKGRQHPSYALLKETLLNRLDQSRHKLTGPMPQELNR